jgi:hypothetical protein
VVVDTYTDVVLLSSNVFVVFTTTVTVLDDISASVSVTTSVFVFDCVFALTDNGDIASVFD